MERRDLEIPLSPSQVEPVEKWFRAFTENQLTMVANPTVENGILKIAPFDFPNLLGDSERRTFDPSHLH